MSTEIRFKSLGLALDWAASFKSTEWRDCPRIRPAGFDPHISLVFYENPNTGFDRMALIIDYREMKGLATCNSDINLKTPVLIELLLSQEPWEVIDPINQNELVAIPVEPAEEPIIKTVTTQPFMEMCV